MTPQQIEKLLLLEQTGELSPKQRHRLQEALATSAAARQQREQWQKMAALLPPPAWQPAPAPEAAARIAARLQATEAATAPIRRPYALHPAWAAAAAILILLAISAALLRPTAPAPLTATAEIEADEWDAWDDPLEADFAALENLLAEISAEPFELADL